IFVIPGFGVVGISGILCIIVGLTLSLIDNHNFDFPHGFSETIGYALFRVTVTLIAGITLAALFGGSIFNFPFFNKMVLKDVQQSDKGFTIKQEDQVEMIGKHGVVISDLRPSGKVEIESNLYDAISDAAFISAGTEVVVTKVQGYSVKVKKA
ncbi:MAG TPA: NfeD family protein, partial [Chitinophagales bacterium]|nr:NfeD family protein [Chitinophagales bacterium]